MLWLERLLSYGLRGKSCVFEATSLHFSWIETVTVRRDFVKSVPNKQWIFAHHRKALGQGFPNMCMTLEVVEHFMGQKGPRMCESISFLVPRKIFIVFVPCYGHVMHVIVNVSFLNHF